MKLECMCVGGWSACPREHAEGVDGESGAAGRGPRVSGRERAGGVRVRIYIHVCASVRARGMGGYSGG